MLFTELPDLSTSTAQQKASLRQDAANDASLNYIQGPEFSAIKVVFEWAQLLTAETPELFNQLRQYHQAIGNIPCSPPCSAAAYRTNPEAVQKACEQLAEKLVVGTLTAQQLVKTDPVELKCSFPELTKRQVELLQVMTAQRLNIEALDVSSITASAPFPITQHNYFGRFLAGACENPKQAARHLLLANPFLIKLRTLIEGLHNDKLNFLQLDVISNLEQEALRTGTKPPPRSGVSDEIRTEILEIVHASINACGDLYAGQIPGNKPLLKTISMPRLPDISDDHIDRKRISDLSVALFDWLFFGKRDNHLLLADTLAPNREAYAKRKERALEVKHSELVEHLTSAPPRAETSETPRRPRLGGSRASNKSRPAESPEYRKWKHKEQEILRHIERLEKEIIALNIERERVVPIIKQLDAFVGRSPEARAEFQTFRREISSAQQRNSKIVFSFLANRYSEAPGNLFDYVDPAYNARKFQRHPAVKLLQDSSFLLCSEAARRIYKGRIPSHDSVVGNNVRNFQFPASDLNLSARYLLAGFLPKREDPQLASLIGTIIGHLPPPGVSTPEQLRQLVKLSVGKRSVTVADYVTYTLERLSSLSEPQILKLMESLRELKQVTLPARVVELATERFNHPPRLLRAYEKYARGYQPNTVTKLPPIFTDQAGFETYLKLGMDALGMPAEVAQIQRHLVESGIVSVVDETDYHPELNAAIEMTGDTLEKSDSEKTDEIWGHYVRPSARVISELALLLMEGDVHPELKNAALVGIVKPDKVDQIVAKIVKKFYGLDIDQTPDLAAINQVLADLKLYHDKPIVVIDANSIRDLEQYRAFLTLLERFEIKVILRTRQPLPGIPQVNIQPFLHDTLADRILADSTRLNEQLDLAEPVSREVVEFAVSQVHRCRPPGHDPLNLTLQLLNTAGAHARLQPDRCMTKRDVVEALSPVFHLPDGKQLERRIASVKHFVKHAPNFVIGQEKAIKVIGDRITNHLLRVRDENSPLTLLLPGPTGVGKTELMMLMAKTCDLPFFMIEAAEFSEEHAISRLVGSPSGYVGPDEGILFKFLKENTSGLVFIDEIEKAHPAFNQHFMNLYWRATLTAGNGKTVTRPSFIIVAASNAGAEKLHKDMSTKEITSVLAEAFVDRLGRPRPELVSRFEPIPMLSIEEPAFKKMLSNSLEALGSRGGFINANLRLVGFDDVASTLLYERTKEVCEFNEKSIKRSGRLGFGELAAIIPDGQFYNLRHVNRAIDDLAGESLQAIVVAQYESGAYVSRDTVLNVKLVGDINDKKIRVVPVG